MSVLAACKPTAYLIDVSRGGIIDHNALIKALNDHKLAGAALDAGVEARITTWLQQAADHPVALNFPEGAYLKGLVVQVS